jgi:hypothetical protein
MWKLILLCVVFLFGFKPLTSTVSSDFPPKISFFEVDVMGNIYLVIGSEIQKYDAHNKLQKTYSNLNFGTISSLDVTDAMNIMVYYGNFNIIVLLDNQLSVKNSPIDLALLGYEEAKLSCISYNNGFWIFDPINQELVRFSQLLEVTNHSGNLLSLTQYNIQPEQIVERDNQLYVRDSRLGIFVFDRYGGYLRRFPFLQLDNMYIRSNSWQLLRNDTLFIYSPKLLQLDTLTLPYNNVTAFRYNEKADYLLDSHGRFNKKER